MRPKYAILIYGGLEKAVQRAQPGEPSNLAGRPQVLLKLSFTLIGRAELLLRTNSKIESCVGECVVCLGNRCGQSWACAAVHGFGIRIAVQVCGITHCRYAVGEQRRELWSTAEEASPI